MSSLKILLKRSLLFATIVITANKTKLRQANDEWDFWAPRILGYEPDQKDVSAKIRKFYFGNVPDIGSIDYLSNYTNMFSDRQFFQPVHHFMEGFAKHSSVRAYMYAYSAEFSLGDVLAATQSER